MQEAVYLAGVVALQIIGDYAAAVAGVAHANAGSHAVHAEGGFGLEAERRFIEAYAPEGYDRRFVAQRTGIGVVQGSKGVESYFVERSIAQQMREFGAGHPRIHGRGAPIVRRECAGIDKTDPVQLCSNTERRAEDARLSGPAACRTCAAALQTFHRQFHAGGDVACQLYVARMRPKSIGMERDHIHVLIGSERGVETQVPQ